MTYKVVIMTYKRKTFRALKLLQDKSLRFCLAVRREEFESGFYDDLKNDFDFMLLDGCTDAGVTRKKIIDECYKDSIDYCVMLDDTIDRIYNSKNEDIKTCIQRSILEMQTHELHDKIIASQIIDELHVDDINNVHSFIAQSFIVNVKMSHDDVQFRSIAECGYDDFTFSYEAYKRGYYIINSSKCLKASKRWEPVFAEAGGTHDANIDVQKVCNRNDMRWLKAFDFLSSMYDTSDIYPTTRKENGHKFCKLKLRRS